MLSFNFQKKRKVLDAAYKRIFNSHDGKLILQDLIEQHRVLNSSFSKDATEMAFAEGERNVVLRILSLIDTSSEAILKKIKEHSERNTEYYTEEVDG